MTDMTQTLFFDRVQTRLASQVERCFVARDQMVTVELFPHQLLSVCEIIRYEADFLFDLLLDVAGVDYLSYGKDDWRTEQTTESGFSRGVSEKPLEVWHADKPSRFAVVYHLLSIGHNQRIRLRVFVPGETPMLPSVISIWNSANWYEREAFDLYGILFDGHPDLRRLLTDYGFVGHPFRKDFPLIGEVELRYDAASERCVYEPVSIQPRILVPKVIRDDSRYLADNDASEKPKHV